MVRQLASSFLALTLAASTLLAPQPAAAAGTVGNGTPASCTEAALTTALNTSGNITFNCGAAPHTIAITSSKTIKGTTSIDGGGLISLSGGTTSYALSVPDDATLNLSNITIRDTGTAEYSIGVTMYNRGTANLVNTTFINNNYRAILNQSGTLTITSSRFEDNTSSAGGSAISNESGSTLTVRDSVFHNNRAPLSYAGGAIYNGASPSKVDIIRSTFTNNGALSGGALVNFGVMNISGSAFTGNTAQDGGGAIQATSNSQLNIMNTTVSGNTARRGGGIYAGGPNVTNAATLTNVTLADNITPATAANTGGANIRMEGNVNITLRNTIVSTSNALLDNCVDGSAGAIVDEGGNMQYPASTCGATITSANPQLGPLADNGGLTLTHALGANSPARNTANNATCQPTDQRGVLRPQDINCDIGAVEYNAVPFLQTFGPTCGISGRAFTVNVAGYNFITGAKGSRIVVNGTELPTTFVSPTQLTAVVPAGLLATAPGTSVPLVVQTPVVDGGPSASQQLGVCRTIHIPQVAK